LQKRVALQNRRETQHRINERQIRDELFNLRGFRNVFEAAECCRIDYYENRPPSAL
jgi:hypothetical protein